MVEDLAELEIDVASSPPPSALAEWAGIMAEVGEARPVVFLDYDGTLTPIVERPEDALLSAGAREAVRTLALTCPVAIISGRDLSDVRDKVGLDGIVYAGSHGFDMAAPPGLDLGPSPVFDDLLPVLDDAQAELARAVAGVARVRVERKRFSIAVHYRQAREEDVPSVAAAVDGVASKYPSLRAFAGKKVFELRPDVAWDKGVALLWLLGQMGPDRPGVVPFYLGDDTTDEDAFRAIRERGIGIVVGATDRPTAARYSLADPGEVRIFLERLSGR